jgi:ubiquinol-cytochrome c reductase iron-sulfur subunit
MTTTDDLSNPSKSRTDLGAGHDGDERIPFARNPRHFGIDPGDPWPDDVPKDQDDTHWRFENDPKGARRAERRVGFFFMITLLASMGLIAVYLADPDNNELAGLFYGLAFGGLGVGLILWARDLLPGNEVTASRGDHAVSPGPERVAVAEAFGRGTDAIARRPFVFKILAPAGGLLGLATIFGPISSLGPRPHKDLYQTFWRRGTRAVTEDGVPIRPTDIPVNGILTVFPEGHIDDALSPTLLINVGAAAFQVQPQRAGWNLVGPYGNIVAFSKICTHAACPASLYNTQTHQLVCPCHQSTFDVLEDCKPVFGPASRALAQLQLSTNGDGHIVSVSDYTREGGGPVGPGFWNRG